MKKIILASGSPRRKELLENIGLDFDVVSSDYEEDMTLDMKPTELAKYLSLGKAQDVATKYTNYIIIAADTFVDVNHHTPLVLSLIATVPGGVGDFRRAVNDLREHQCANSRAGYGQETTPRDLAFSLSSGFLMFLGHMLVSLLEARVCARPALADRLHRYPTHLPL
jgi:hypothetical protein